MAEVEKIWIVYDLDENGVLDYEEISLYLKKTAYPNLNLTDDHLKAMFDHIDLDGNGTIDKHEMERFLTMLIQEQKDLIFRQNGDGTSLKN